MHSALGHVRATVLPLMHTRAVMVENAFVGHACTERMAAEVEGPHCTARASAHKNSKHRHRAFKPSTLIVDPAAARRSTTSCEAKTRVKLLRLPSHKRQEVSHTRTTQVVFSLYFSLATLFKQGKLQLNASSRARRLRADTQWSSSHSGGSRPQSLVTTRVDSLARQMSVEVEVG